MTRRGDTYCIAYVLPLVKPLYCIYSANMARNISKTFRFTKEESELLDNAKKRYGSYSAAIVAALRKEAGQDELSKEELLAMIKERLG